MSHEEQIIEFIVGELVMGKDVKVAPETELIAEGVLDSVALVELVVWIESTYGIGVDIEDLTPATFGSVARIATYVRNHPEARQVAQTA